MFMKDYAMQFGEKSYFCPAKIKNPAYMSDEQHLHPISKWLLRTVFDHFYAENDEQIIVQIGESTETINEAEYKQLQQDLIALGYSEEEICRGVFDEE